METVYSLNELSWIDFLAPQPKPFFNPLLAHEKSAHHASFSGLLCVCPRFLVKFSVRAVFEDHPFLDLTENIMFILNYCRDFF